MIVISDAVIALLCLLVVVFAGLRISGYETRRKVLHRLTAENLAMRTALLEIEEEANLYRNDAPTVCDSILHTIHKSNVLAISKEKA